jgi:prepilin-type N-terminal cleavage/methylation domain-containing protein
MIKKYKESVYKPHNPNINNGFTLVEIAIVMMVIGLIIGGIFGGIKLIDNSNIQKTSQDLKSFESAIFTFKNAYNSLPGDIESPATELPDCTTAPCSRSGNSNDIIGSLLSMENEALTVTSEKFTMWSHLLAAGLIDKVVNQDDMTFGVGQIESPLGGGYRMNQLMTGNQISAGHPYRPWGHALRITGVPSEIVSTPANLPSHRIVPCAINESLDIKIDDGIPRLGRILTNVTCMANPADPLSRYGNPTASGSPIFIFKL